ncbi:MAG: patatin-like phospholipase family protein, partial [Pseudomonadota bacterium]
RDGEIRLPVGLLYGQTMSGLYRESLGNIEKLESFDNLAIPFRAVATDLETSNAVVLKQGDLIKALQASATVPGVLVPVKIGDQYLVDGGMSENLPISQVRKMGADIVIAVDVSAPLQKLDELNSGGLVLEQISNFLTIKNLEEQKKLLGDNDFYIRPEVDHLGTADFSILPEAFAAGQKAVQQQSQLLKKLAIASSDYRDYQQRKREKLNALKINAAQPIVDVVLVNNSRFEDAYLLKTLGVQKGAVLTVENLTTAIDRVYALDQFERVDASFEAVEDGRVLVVEVVEKSWGPNNFEIGLGWEDDFTLDSVVKVDLAYTLGEITDNNGEWRNEVGFGTDKKVRTEVYLPLNAIQDYYHTARYEFSRKDRNFFIDNNRATVFEVVTHQVDLSLGHKLGNHGVVEAGVVFEKGEVENKVFLEEDLTYSSPGLFLRFGYDQLDRLSFPSDGTLLDIRLTFRDEDTNGNPVLASGSLEDDYRSVQFLLDWKAAARWNNHVLIGKASLAYLDSEADQSIQYVELGGFLNLSGYHKSALVGNNKVFTAVAYQYDLGRQLFGLKDFPVYVGASLETGYVWPTGTSIDTDDLIAASSIYLSTDSKLGPVALAIGVSEDDNDSIYFFLGKNI